MDRTELAQVLLELVEDETGDKFTDIDDDTDLRTGLAAMHRWAVHEFDRVPVRA